MITTCFSKDRLLIFTDQGRVYGLKAWETPLGSRHSQEAISETSSKASVRMKTSSAFFRSQENSSKNPRATS